jgi:archaellum component FlaG (FlaF/FlaG flagellin family)
VSFAAITLCVASQRVFIVVVVVAAAAAYFVIDSVRKLLDSLSRVCVKMKDVGAERYQQAITAFCEPLLKEELA